MITIKSPRELEKMREAGRIAADAMREAAKIIRPGISTLEVDKLVEQVIRDNGAKPAFKGYDGFPGSICASVNDQVVHGIPSKKRILREGDIFKIDMGAIWQGYYSDMARTFPVGEISPEAAKLIKVTRECFYKGLENVAAGAMMMEVSGAIQEHAESNGFSVVRELVGHGIGQNLHEDPNVPNYITNRRGPRLKEGMTLAIEPMINAGAMELKVATDGWAWITRDGSYSAHYENTVAVTANGAEILTPCEEI